MNHNDYEQIKYEVANGVATLTLNRPDRMNAWTRQMHRELTNAIEASNASPDVGAMVITGAGRGFCAGADIKDTFQKQIVTSAAPQPKAEQMILHISRRNPKQMLLHRPQHFYYLFLRILQNLDELFS